MSEGLVAIYLHGHLGQMFGSEHRYAVQTPMEAIRALDVNCKGFRREFIKAERYYVRVDGDWRDGDSGAFFPVSKEVHFVPVIEGQAFIGAILIGALIPSIAGTTMATFLGGLLVSALVIGVSLLLTPKAKEKTSGDKEQSSYLFTGPQNVIGQGAAVPIVYGRCMVGSVVISAGIETGDELVPQEDGWNWA